MQAAIVAGKGHNLLAVVPVCGRDRELMEPFETLFRAVWPGAEIVWAIDTADPVSPPSGRAVPCTWQHPRRARAVLDAMVSAATQSPAEWVIKADVDVAHLNSDWLDLARPNSALVGLQNGRAWFGMLGMVFALRREVLYELHAGADCSAPGPESDAIHAAVRRQHLNHVWLWPHRPRDGGLFCSMTDPAKAARYWDLFSLVHCGTGPRQNAAGLLRSFLAD